MNALLLVLHCVVPDRVESPRSINAHALNAVMVVGDLLLSRAPVRWQHGLYSMAFVLVYILFTVFYWAAGGQSHKVSVCGGQALVYLGVIE
jgi:hypothetical protein